jgi:hypothetical protein
MNKPRSLRPLSELVRPVLAEALKAQGFAAADILQSWPEIAGERLAEHSIPVRVMWPPRPKVAAPGATPRPATLVLKVDSAFALEVEMAAAQIVERVNAVFGWRCVGKIRLRHGPVASAAAAVRVQRAGPELDGASRARLAREVGGIADDALRASLERLGRAILVGKPVRRA